jgi:hypothetical protein
MATTRTQKVTVKLMQVLALSDSLAQDDAALQLLTYCGCLATASMLHSCFLGASSSSHSINAICSSLHDEQQQ